MAVGVTLRVRPRRKTNRMRMTRRDNEDENEKGETRLLPLRLLCHPPPYHHRHALRERYWWASTRYKVNSSFDMAFLTNDRFVFFLRLFLLVHCRCLYVVVLLTLSRSRQRPKSEKNHERDENRQSRRRRIKCECELAAYPALISFATVHSVER